MYYVCVIYIDSTEVTASIHKLRINMDYKHNLYI